MTNLVTRLSRFLLGRHRDIPAHAPVAAVGRELVLADGYSRLELIRAGLTVERAQEMGLAIDLNRWSAVGTNVIQLQRLLQRQGRRNHG